MERADLPSIYKRCAYEKKVIAKRLRIEQTSAEVVLWDKLRANRLTNLHFRRQHVLCGFIADFYCRSAGLVVEVDGQIHEEQLEYDRERDAILEAAGINVIRFSNDRVLTAIDSVLAEIIIAANIKPTNKH